MELRSAVSKDILTCVLINVCIIVVPIVLPFLALPIHMLAPLPSLFYRSKLGRQCSQKIFFITIPLIGIILGGISLAFFGLIGLMAIGFVLGELFEKNFSIEITILISCSFVAFYIIICLLCYSFHTQTDILSLLLRYIDGNINSFLKICENSNISNEIIVILEQRREDLVNFIVLTSPSSIIVTVVIITWINILAVKPLMLKNGIKYPTNFGHLDLWYAPENLIWALIGSGLALIIGNKFFWFIGINSFIALMLIYFFQGVAITSFYLTKKKVSIVARTIVYSVIFLNQFFLMIVVGLGVFDVWYNFRRIEKIN